tara:strand:+ start:480 stop:1070 length:591 start_codon:yes stop_codon:yes gene_type:complete
MLLLVGCAGQSANTSVPVEDRSQVQSPVSQKGPVAAVRVLPSQVLVDAPPVSQGETWTGGQNKAEPAVQEKPHPQAKEVTSGMAKEGLQAKSAIAIPAGSSSAVSYPGPSPVLLALMEQADSLEFRGDLQGALAQLERAQRIEPRDPLIYLQLARLRLHMNDRARAEQLTRKGLSLAGGDSDLRLAFEALLRELKP